LVLMLLVKPPSCTSWSLARSSQPVSWQMKRRLTEMRLS
jgi:hypothetical protein